jgi:hypothetical protein
MHVGTYIERLRSYELALQRSCEVHMAITALYIQDCGASDGFDELILDLACIFPNKNENKIK